MKKFYYRKAIQELLLAIEQLDPMTGPTEMICGWFDDYYCPADPKIDSKSQAFADWRSCFTDVQLDALKRFHAVFENVVDDLLDDSRTFQEDPKWRELSNLAKEIRPILGSSD